MTHIVTGYKRSLKIVVNKTIDGILAAGYPKYYPTALDVLNGYFTLNGINYSIPSQEQLGLMEQSEYDVLLLRFKQYVSLHEPDLSFSSDFINLPEVYAPDECYQITTTTTPVPVTTTTTEEIITTTTTELVTTTTTEEIIAFCSGLLYNYPAITNDSEVAPDGYHVASEEDWANLLGYLGGEDIAGGKLKSATNWDAPNTGATDETGFTGIASGKRSDLGEFFSKGSKAYYWIKNINEAEVFTTTTTT